jgi:Protein of unknown function (DUF1353)
MRHATGSKGRLVMMRVSFHRRLLAAGLILIPLLCGAANAEDRGRFVGRVAVEWLDENGDSRSMRLLEEFAFVEPTGKVWAVPKGAVINGASIPRLFWSLIGPPFVGAYRRASVIHDYYCEARSEPWLSVHRMFYEASLAGGVPESTAKIMYFAVYGAGPRWSEATGADRAGRPRMLPSPKLGEASADEIKQWIEAENPSLEDIESRVDQDLAPAAQ